MRQLDLSLEKSPSIPDYLVKLSEHTDGSVFQAAVVLGKFRSYHPHLTVEAAADQLLKTLDDSLEEMAAMWKEAH